MHYMKKAEKHTLTNSKMTSCKYTNDMDVKAAFLLDEAVDKWAEDNDENHTAAEDHHLFLKDRREQEAEAQSRCHVFNWAWFVVVIFTISEQTIIFQRLFAFANVYH